jgi:exosortase E/protease (VPEID-CTERM system)
MVALLLGEIIFLSMQFDTAALDGRGWAMAWIGSLSPQVLRICVASFAALAVLGGPGLSRALAAVCQQDESVPAGRFFLSLHLVALAAFVTAASLFFDHRGPATLSDAAWLGASLFSAAVAAGAWLLATLSPANWVRVLQGGRGGLAVGGLVGLAAWVSGTATYQLWRPLSRATLAIADFLLSPFETGLICIPEKLIVGTPEYSVIVKPECSGCEGIGLILVFLGTFLWLWRNKLKFPRAFVLLPLGAATIWVANALRITATVVIGTHWSSDIAAGGFHSQAGWLIMNAIALGIVAWARGSHWLRLDTTPHPPAAYNPSVPYLLPFLAVVLVSMLTTAFSTDSQGAFYAARPVVGLVMLWCCRRNYARHAWRWSWEPLALGGAVATLWIVLTQSDGGNSRGLGDFAPDLTGAWLVGWWIIRVVGYVVVAPVIEELAFRGFLTRRLISSDFDEVPMGRFTWLGFLGSSLAFGAVHGALWAPGAIAGALFAMALYRRGRLADAVVAHAVANAGLALYAAATQHWEVFG